MKHWLFSGLMLGAAWSAAGAVGKGYDVGSGFETGQYKYSKHSFETPAEISAVTAEGTFSERHFKHGKGSMQMDFAAAPVLEICDPDGMKLIGSTRTGGVKFWMYRETPSGEILWLEAGGKTGKPRWQFPVGQNFTGWRAVWCLFQEDARSVDPKAPLEVLRFRGGKSLGKVWFDRMELSEYIYWARESDAQQQVNHRQKGGLSGIQRIWDAPVDMKIAPVTEEERAGMKLVTERFLEWLSGSGAGEFASQLLPLEKSLLQKAREGMQNLRDFQMVRHADGRITGNPVFNVIHGGLPQIRSLFDMGVLPLALTYRMPGTAELPNPYYRNPEVRDLILLAFDHAHDQGWAAGSAMGTAYGVNLGLAGYNISIFLMRDELEKAGILDREIATSHYYSSFREHYKPMEFAHGIAGADGMRTVALFKLMTIASMPQSDLQIELMRRYCAWLRASLTVSRGLNELIKPDGTLYHHWNPYWSGYGNHGIEMAARLGYFLRGTAFELPRELRENVKKALLTARFVAHKYALPISINGRWPMFEDSLIPALAGFAYGAMMMEDGKIDPELAAAFMRLYDPEYPAVKERFFEVKLGGNTFASTPGNCADMLRFAAVCGVAAEDDPQGNLALPYAGAMFHRRGNAFVAIKGNSKYIWDYESQACGQLGRNLSRGSIIVYSAGDPVTLKANGYEWPGWDWARIPGTTTIRKTFAQMDPLLIKDTSRHNTDQTAVGGMSFGANGVYMMRFHDTTYDKSFCFDQSVWCYGDWILSLGSGVRNSDTADGTETTLFQRRLTQPDAMPTTVNGESFNAMDYRFNGSSGAVMITDSRKLNYIIPDASKLRVFRQKQDYPVAKHGRDTGGKGDYEVAVIDHGKAPSGSSWEYWIGLNGASRLPEYQILHRNGDFHAVRFPDVTALAIFARGTVDCGGVYSVDAPALIALEPEADGAMQLTVCDPDFGRNWRINGADPAGKYLQSSVNFENIPGFLQVVLQGAWQGDLPGGSVKVENGKTRLTIPVADGAAVSLRLKPVPES